MNRDIPLSCHYRKLFVGRERRNEEEEEEEPAPPPLVAGSSFHVTWTGREGDFAFPSLIFKMNFPSWYIFYYLLYVQTGKVKQFVNGSFIIFNIFFKTL